MGEMKIKISDNTESMFRRMAMQKFGYQKGSISLAAQKAFDDWTFLNIEITLIKNPVEEISGLMKKVKKSSLELQHEIGGVLAEKYANRR